VRTLQFDNDEPISVRPSVLLSLATEFADAVSDGMVPEDDLADLADEFVQNVISAVAP